MPYSTIGLIAVIYIILLFAVGYITERYGRVTRVASGSVVYALSLAVYCTAWTFYGSIGRAADVGIGYVAVYLGPTLLAPLWMFFLRKVLYISREQRITSVADFLSARFGKSTAVGAIVAIACVIITIPYISIQLKALSFSISLLHTGQADLLLDGPFYTDPILWATVLIGVFAMVFGTLRVDATERHPGVVNVIAIESIVKLLCFLVGAGAIVWGVYDGIGDIFTKATSSIDLASMAQLGGGGVTWGSWVTVMVLSAFAFLLLPRQFHMAVVENVDPDHLRTASWMTPLYLLLISLLVLPVAIGGKMLYGDLVEADTYLLRIPHDQGLQTIAIVVFVGGLSAISGMMVISVIALTTMISNNVLLPLILRVRRQFTYFLQDLDDRIIQIRRLTMAVILLLSYGFYELFTINYSLVSVGLISFAGICQLLPAMIAALYWRSATRPAVIASICVGLVIWAYTLPYANLLALDSTAGGMLSDGPWGIAALRPTALLGLTGMAPLEHSVFWSLSANSLVLVVVSLMTTSTMLEISQADIFVHPARYIGVDRPIGASDQAADYLQLQAVMTSILGADKVTEVLQAYYLRTGRDEPPQIADGPLIRDFETYLSGSLGSASARIILANVVEERPIDPQELLSMLGETRQVYEQRQQLELQSQELATANQQLQQLDKLKNEFISNVTHELRTPITSIRSLAGILHKYPVTDEERKKFLQVIKEESDRISNLVNQVLDLRRLEANTTLERQPVDILRLSQTVVVSLSQLAGQRNIVLPTAPALVMADQIKLHQVLVNLISNAIKFTDPLYGEIVLSWRREAGRIIYSVWDNGKGIPAVDLSLVFERFYQVAQDAATKHAGSGLGLSICASYVQAMGGTIAADSRLGEWTRIDVSLQMAPQSATL